MVSSSIGWRGISLIAIIQMAVGWVHNQTMQRTLIIVGISLVIIGLLWPWLGKLPLGRLPGDIIIDRPGFKFYFPITTMVLISLLISLLIWLFRK